MYFGSDELLEKSLFILVVVALTKLQISPQINIIYKQSRMTGQLLFSFSYITYHLGCLNNYFIFFFSKHLILISWSSWIPYLLGSCTCVEFHEIYVCDFSRKRTCFRLQILGKQIQAPNYVRCTSRFSLSLKRTSTLHKNYIFWVFFGVFYPAFTVKTLFGNIQGTFSKFIGNLSSCFPRLQPNFPLVCSRP